MVPHSLDIQISGTGTIDNSGAFPVWTIQYDLIQSGKSILTAANGVPAGYLEAVITTNPDKKSVPDRWHKSWAKTLKSDFTYLF